MKALTAAIVLLLLGAAFLVANYGFPVAVTECAITGSTSESFHVDENTAGPDLYYLTYLRVDGTTFHTVEVSPEILYSIGPASYVLVMEYRARLTGQPLYYEAVFDYDKQCRDSGSTPSGVSGGGIYPISTSQ